MKNLFNDTSHLMRALKSFFFHQLYDWGEKIFLPLAIGLSVDQKNS